MTKKINLKKLDKTNWQKFRFDEIAKSITERVDPKNTELKIYIGLEHLDPESIHIKRNGTRDDVKGQKLKCYPGDVIFGKRRAYQRKAAIVTQEGFCSAHSMVLRANPEVIDPKLFPFFLHSDQFMNRAIDISVGSLSPTINWGTLKKQEFLLPPKEQQAKLAELLWAMDQVVEKELRVLEKLKLTKQIFFEENTHNSIGIEVDLSDLLIHKKAKSITPHKREKYIGLEHIESGEYRCTNYSNSSEVKAQCNVIDVDDLCYSKLRPYLDKAFIATFDAISTTELLIYDTQKVSKEYILYILHSISFLNYINSKGFGTKMPRVSHKIIGDYKVKILQNEKELLRSMRKYGGSEQILKSKLNTSKILQKSLINEVF